MTEKLFPWIQTVLKKNNITNLNEIQIQSFNSINIKKNTIGISATGTGKTYAFLLPILMNINFDSKTQAIIILPTKELARQIHNKLVDFKKEKSDLRTSLIIGGESINSQIESIQKIPHIIVATPNRLIEIIKSNKQLFNFTDLKFLVLDEADMLLDLGFFNLVDQIFNFLSDCKIEFQKIAYSATFHDLLSRKLSKYFKNTNIIDHSTKLDTRSSIEHVIIENKDKKHSLSILLNTINPYLCLIFANEKKDVEEIYKFLKEQKRNVIKLHGGLKSRERKINFNNIKNIKYQYVVCSDLLSRGMDIDGSSHIISWNIPDQSEWYIHRSGRTGRSKYTGYSYILSDGNDEKQINKLIEKGINFSVFKIKNNTLSKVQTKKRNYKKPISQEEINEIKKVRLNKKIKPNYKKKRKEEIKKISSKYKRKTIDAKIKKKTNLKAMQK